MHLLRPASPPRPHPRHVPCQEYFRCPRRRPKRPSPPPPPPPPPRCSRQRTPYHMPPQKKIFRTARFPLASWCVPPRSAPRLAGAARKSRQQRFGLLCSYRVLFAYDMDRSVVVLL